MNQRLQQVKNYVSKGYIEDAITHLIEYLKDLNFNKSDQIIKRFETTLTAISARYSDLRTREHQGITKIEEYRPEFASITVSILTLVNEVFEHISSSPNIPIHEKPINGFTRLDATDAMNLAIEKLADAQNMIVIGMGRQDIAELPGDNHVKKYYRAIENRFNDDKQFSIKRVTQHLLKPNFRGHIKNCYEILSKLNSNESRYELVLYGDLKITATYYVITSYDNTASLFMTLNTKIPNEYTVDNNLVFYSTDPDIVEAYRDHFDEFWRIESEAGRMIKSLRDYKRYIPFDLGLYTKYTDIKHIIKRIPDDSVRMLHLKKEVDIFHKRLKGIDDCKIVLRHSNKNQRVTDCFVDYFNNLRYGNKRYRAISLDSFWKTLYHIPRLIEKQAIALKSGADMKRILMVAPSALENDDHNNALHLAISRNYSHHLKFDNYSFYVFFLDSDREMMYQENFAIWEDVDLNYKVLFDMEYGLKTGGTTTISFANYSIDEKMDMRVNQDRINEKDSEFDYLLSLVRDKNKDLLEYYSLSKSNEKNFSNESKLLSQQLEFLITHGVDDVESFLTVKNN